MTSTNLIGVWSVDVMYGPGAMSDWCMVLRPDGLGRFELINPVLVNAWTFQWSVSKPNVMSLVGDTAFEINDKDEVETFPWEFKETVGFTIREEVTPSGRRMSVLRFERRFMQFLPEAFGHCRSDVEGFEEPDFSWLDRSGI